MRTVSAHISWSGISCIQFEIDAYKDMLIDTLQPSTSIGIGAEIE